jgi:hypothetical protein
MPDFFWLLFPDRWLKLRIDDQIAGICEALNLQQEDE